MANSNRHRKLIARIKNIERNLLPDVKLSGNYTKKESDLIRSYVLLVHAEIEAYFEDVALLKVQNALNKWLSNRQRSNILLSIMNFCSTDINWEKRPNERNKAMVRVNIVVRHYIDLLSKNHGVKSNNLYNILLPLGIEEDELDQTWLNTMDAFGQKRGLYAHSTHSVQTQIDLVTERNAINTQILPEIENLDNLIMKLK